MNIDLIKCKGHSYCKEQDEVDKFFKGKFLVLLYNQIRFEGSFLNEETIIPES